MNYLDPNGLFQCVSDDWMGVISEYQKTRSERLFSILLLKYDKLLMKIVHQMHRKEQRLKGEEFQELYHVAIIGFADAMERIPKGECLNKIPAWISSYVKLSLSKTFRLKRKRLCLSDLAINNSSDMFPAMKANLDVQTLLSTAKLGDSEMDTLRRYYFQNETQVSIARTENKTRQAVCRRLRRVLDKLRKALHFRENYQHVN